MHASVDQLLNLRDGEPVDAGIKLHLEQCALCTARLQALVQARQHLCSLPSFEAPPLDWRRVNSMMPRTAYGVRRWMPSAAVAATGLILALMIGVAMQGSMPPPAVVNAMTPAGEKTEKNMDSAAIKQLIARSRALDEVLSGMPQPPAVERVALAATMETIEQRVQWLDWQLSSESGEPVESVDTARMQSLWRERVALMDSLIKVRYAEAGRSYL